MTGLDELGRIAFKTKMAAAPLDALALIETIQQHFSLQTDAVTYFRSIPDLRLVSLWKNAKDELRDQVFATIKWQPRLLAFKVGAFIAPNVWSNVGFEGATLFKKNSLISEIGIPPKDWRQKQQELLSVLDAAKSHMLAGR